MDLNPREAIVTQESSHTSKQVAEPTNALVVPATFMEAAMDGLKRQAVLKNLVVVTACVTTRKRRPHDYDCGDVGE